MHHNTVTPRVVCQGCQVFTTKSAQLLLKTGPKRAQSHFEEDPPVKIAFRGVKYTFFGGVPLVRFALQGLNIKFLEANRRPGNTVACQFDASSEDCLDVFDLKQRCWTNRCVCHQSTARAIRERTSPYAFSRRTLMSYTDLQVEHTSLLSRVTWQCNRSLCGWRITFFHIVILSQIQLIVQS